MEHTQLYTKITLLPNDIKAEVNDFIDFLITQKKKEVKKKAPKFGCVKGQIYMSPNFDGPLDDFKDYSSSNDR